VIIVLFLYYYKIVMYYILGGEVERLKIAYGKDFATKKEAPILIVNQGKGR
jgi:hypothetical protein